MIHNTISAKAIRAKERKIPKMKVKPPNRVGFAIVFQDGLIHYCILKGYNYQPVCKTVKLRPPNLGLNTPVVSDFRILKGGWCEECKRNFNN